MGKLTTVLITLAIFTLSLSSISAQMDVPYESVNPTDGISYLLKRINEKISLFFAFSDGNKVKSYKRLTNVRLAELKFIIENKRQAYFEKSTQRYFTVAGEFVSFITSKNLKSEFIPVREQLQSQIPILTGLRNQYSPESAEWRFVEDDINYVKGYIDKLPAR